MKACISILAGLAVLTLSGCGGGGGNPTTNSSNPTTNGSTHNEWTWVDGSSSANQGGTYGTQGTPAAANVPGGRYGGASWTDNSGNFWLFGGIFAPSSTQDNFYNDLWKFNGSQWTWMGGPNNFNQAGIYGTMGTPDPRQHSRGKIRGHKLER